MTKSERRAPLPERDPRAVAETPADILARGWIDALGRLDPRPDAALGDQGGALNIAEHWTVETLLKLGFAAPDRAYEVGLRIVELSDDPWILETVGVSVFQDLLRRDGAHFVARLSDDARRLPRLRHTLARVAPNGLDKLAGTRLGAFRQALS